MSIYLWHILAYPLYQILSTIRHELAHAIVVTATGGTVIEFNVFPHKRNARWYWGYTRWLTFDGWKPSAHVYLAPYYVNLICGGVWIYLRNNVPFQNEHWWIFTTVMLAISPVVDTLYNVGKWLFLQRGDFQEVVG